MDTQPSTAIAYLNGELIPAALASVSVADLGLHGLGVTEMLRTFAGKPFRLQEHLQRFRTGLDYLGIRISQSNEQLSSQIQAIADHNYSLSTVTSSITSDDGSQALTTSGDLGIVLFATPGLNATYLGTAPASPTVCIHSFALPFSLWKPSFEEGVKLTLTSRPQIPAETLSPMVKLRSRAYWHLVDREAAAIQPGSRALVQTAEGTITETSTGNLFVLKGQKLWTPPEDLILPGISRAMILDLAHQLGIEVQQTRFDENFLLHSDGAFVTSTPYCMLKVGEVNHQPLRTSASDEMYDLLANAWEAEVGFQWRTQLA